MNTFKTAITSILACILLCSCVATPENLKEPSETIPEKSSSQETISGSDGADSGDVKPDEEKPVERGNLEVIRSQLNADLKKTYKNIDIVSARVGEAETMPTYDVKLGRNPDYDFRKLIEYFYSDKYDCSDEKYYIHRKTGELQDPDDEYPPHYEPTKYNGEDTYVGMNAYAIDIDGFEPTEDDLYESTLMYSVGNVWGSETGCFSDSGEVQRWYFYSLYSVYKSYYLFSEKPDSNEKYVMMDGQEWNVLEAIEFMENFWNEYIAPSDPAEYTYSVKTVYIISLEDDKYGYLFSMQKQDQYGNYIDVDHSSFYYGADSRPDGAVAKGEPFIYATDIYAYCAEKEVLTRFTKEYSFSYETAQDQGTDLLTLGSAMDILSDTLSPNSDLKLTAELNYVPMCKGYPYCQEWELPIFYDHYCFATCDFEIRPVWCFRKPDQCNLMNEFKWNRYFVDAVTGDVSLITNGDYLKWKKKK